MNEKSIKRPEVRDEFRYPPGILATCCIPWDQDFNFDETIFRRAVRSILEHTPLVYIFGTAGEGYAVNREEYSHIVSVFADEMKKWQADPMVGIIGLSLSEILMRIEIAWELGVKTFQISLPSWDTLNRKETEVFFREVLLSFPGADFFHYNLKRAGRLIMPREYAALSKKYTNFVGAKITTVSTRYFEELMGLNLPLRFFFTGPGYAHASTLGECGFLISLASCNWKTARLYYEAGRGRDRNTLMQLQTELGCLTRELMSCVGTSGHIDGAYDKIFLKIHMPDFPLRLLPPYSYPPDSVFEQFRDALKTRYPRWYDSSGQDQEYL